MIADYWDEQEPNLAATAAALVKLEADTTSVLNDAERLIGRARLMMHKQKIMLSALRKILIRANGGVMPDLPVERRFPELS